MYTSQNKASQQLEAPSARLKGMGKELGVAEKECANIRQDIATKKVWSRIGQRTKKLWSQYNERPKTVAVANKQTTLSAIIAARRRGRGSTQQATDKSGKPQGDKGSKFNAAIEQAMAEADIQNHFDEKLRGIHARLLKEQEHETAMIEALNKPNACLRYQERLYLNRKGYQPAFKAVTREKRNNQLDGNKGTEAHHQEAPAVGHYRPNYRSVQRNQPSPAIMDASAYTEDLDCANNSHAICAKLLYSLVNEPKPKSRKAAVVKPPRRAGRGLTGVIDLGKTVKVVPGGVLLDVDAREEDVDLSAELSVSRERSEFLPLRQSFTMQKDMAVN